MCFTLGASYGNDEWPIISQNLRKVCGHRRQWAALRAHAIKDLPDAAGHVILPIRSRADLC